MSKSALCVGINDYPGSYNDLNGCVNDATDWAALLEEVYQFDNVQLLLDAQASKTAILSALSQLISGAAEGDTLVFTYSGHGTWVYDQGERDESDNRDEALCAVDANILDDELRGILATLGQNIRLTVISDSCHSGSVTRTQLMRTYTHDRAAAGNAPKPRFMPPKEDVDTVAGMFLPVRRRVLYPESGMHEILLTGCNATEYSYDAFVNGRFNGALTATAIGLIRANPGQSYRELHEAIRQLLPSPRFPQSPQLEGSDANKSRALFT